MFSSTEVDLNWTNYSQSAIGYNILSSVNGGNFGVVDTVGASATSYNDASLSPSTTVQYKLQAVGDTSDIVSLATGTTEGDRT